MKKKFLFLSPGGGDLEIGEGCDTVFGFFLEMSPSSYIIYIFFFLFLEKSLFPEGFKKPPNPRKFTLLPRDRSRAFVDARISRVKDY